MLLEETEQGRAARAAIEPDEYWVLSGLAERLNEDVVKALGCGHVKEAAVPVGRQWGTVRERGYFIGDVGRSEGLT